MQAASHNIVIHGTHLQSGQSSTKTRRALSKCFEKKKKKKEKEILTVPLVVQLADVIVNNFSRGNRTFTRIYLLLSQRG